MMPLPACPCCGSALRGCLLRLVFLVLASVSLFAWLGFGAYEYNANHPLRSVIIPYLEVRNRVAMYY